MVRDALILVAVVWGVQVVVLAPLTLVSLLRRRRGAVDRRRGGPGRT